MNRREVEKHIKEVLDRLEDKGKNPEDIEFVFISKTSKDESSAVYMSPPTRIGLFAVELIENLGEILDRRTQGGVAAVMERLSNKLSGRGEH